MNPFPKEDLFELRLFLEEIVSNICRFTHVTEYNINPRTIRIRQEFHFGIPDAFADIFIQVTNYTNYFIEVDYGYSPERIIESIGRKYGQFHPFFNEISQLILVVDCDYHHDWESCAKQVQQIIPASWKLQIWDEAHLLALINQRFEVQIEALSPDNISDLRLAIEDAKGKYAFEEAYSNDPLDATLMWQFGYWRLRELFEASNRNKGAILQPINYCDVVVIFADLSGFSSYVRDTPHKKTIQECLSAFCTKARYQIINDGGMLYQFLGDAVIGLFGIPERSGNYIEHSFECARSLLTLGDAISNEWQRQLDRLQPVHGSHIGMAMGDLQMLSLRPYSQTHTGAIADAINMAARLSSHAESGQIVMSNLVYRELTSTSQRLLKETKPIEAKNVGRIKAWLFDQAEAPPNELSVE